MQNVLMLTYKNARINKILQKLLHGGVKWKKKQNHLKQKRLSFSLKPNFCKVLGITKFIIETRKNNYMHTN